jgi:large subunit ribosomal protein L9
LLKNSNKEEYITMRVILNNDIPNLGEEGDIKNVADGFARNFLLPEKLVMPYTKQNLKILAQKKVFIDKRKEEKRKNASDMKSRLEAEQLLFVMTAGANGKLFGSVNAAMIADALEKKGYPIEKKRIEIPDNTIRMIGTYDVKVRLYEQNQAIVKVVVEHQQGKTAES